MVHSLIVSGWVMVCFVITILYSLLEGVKPSDVWERSIMSSADCFPGRFSNIFQACPSLHMARMMAIRQAGTRFDCMRMGSQM